MNKLIIIGNLTREPVLRATQTGISVCDFTVAVNGRQKNEETQFFRVTAWRGLAEICAKFLIKGQKVCVSGPVSCRSYQTQNGENRVSMEIKAEDVEFLSARDSVLQDSMQNMNGMTPVDPPDIPF